MLNISVKDRLARFAFFAFVFTLMPFYSSTALSAELLMLEQVGCSWCIKWDKEIGSIYPKTVEAKIAPLRKVDINEPWPRDLGNISIDRFTPTFVVVDNGKEIGRMRGYAGDEFFWTLLGEILNKLPNSNEDKNSDL